MLTVAFPAAAFGTNCYVLATGAGEECLVVDPGVGIEDQLAEVLREHRLRPAAVLLTHGHVDHVWSVTPVCGGELAAYLHTDDTYRLHDLMSTVSPQLLGMFEQQFGPVTQWREPERVVEITDGQRLELAGLSVGVRHAPGHTEGSVVFTLDDVPHVAGADVSSTCLSGDVLFAGSIGRTDLAGGDQDAMTRSLRDVVLPMADDTLVLPGHGSATTIGLERASNPYLRGLTA